MGGWLNLSRQGLSPCKMLQASLVALTSYIRGLRQLGLAVPKWSDSDWHSQTKLSQIPWMLLLCVNLPQNLPKHISNGFEILKTPEQN